MAMDLDPDRYALVLCISQYDHLHNLPGVQCDRGPIIAELEKLRFHVWTPPTGYVTKKELDRLVGEFLRAMSEIAKVRPWLILFVWISAHAIQNGYDNYAHIVASDCKPIPAECFGIRMKLIRELNEIVAVQPGRLRVALVFECCRENAEDSCFRPRGKRNWVRRLRNDFYMIFACDPGRKTWETDAGGELASQLLPLLPYAKPISQIFNQAAIRVGGQRAWVETRPGCDEPVLGDLLGDLPHHLPILLGHTDGLQAKVPEILGLPDDDSLISISSHQEPDELSDFEVLRLYWAPMIALFALLIHGSLLLLWLCGVTAKRYATRLAMPPALSFLALALVLQGPETDEPPPQCGSAIVQHGLMKLWYMLDKYTMSGWGATCFFVLSVGEITKEQDWAAATVSCLLAIAAICVNGSKCSTLSSFRARSTNISHQRNAVLWLCICFLSVYFAFIGHHALLSHSDAAEHEVEANFHLFMLISTCAWYITLVHDSDPAFSGCSTSNQVALSYTLVLLLAIGIPFIQSICQSASLNLSWTWQVWLLVEYCGLYFLAVVYSKFRQTHAEVMLVADDKA